MKMFLIPSVRKISPIVKGIIYGFKLVGLAPFYLQESETTSVFSISKVGLVYNLSLSILVFIMGVIAIPRTSYMNYPNKSSITQAIDVSHSIIRTFACCVVIASWALRQGMAASIMNRILEIDCLLSETKNRSASKSLAPTLLITYITLNGLLWVIFLVSVETSFNSFPDWFVANVPVLVINWFIMEYSVLLGVVAEEVKIVNKNLFNLEDRLCYRFRTPFLDNYLTVLQTLSYHSTQLPELGILHIIRTTLFEVSLDIAEFFSLPILPCIACSCLTLIYNIHYLVAPVIIPIGTSALSVTDCVNTLAWISISIYPLALLASNVTETLKEVRLTGRAVHKLLLTMKRGDSNIKLERFSHQLLHEELNFTAHGFFRLDFTLIQSIFGTTVTYLVIIIQFTQSVNKELNHQL